MKPVSSVELDFLLVAARRDLEGLRGARIFVTGGTGFFGKWILETLLHARRKLLGGELALCVLSRDPNRETVAFPREEVEWVQGDVTQFQFPRGEFTHVIHAATPARAAFNQRQPLEMLAVTGAGTQRVLEFSHQAGVGRFLFTSSGAVYGPQPPELLAIAEDYRCGMDPMNPLNAYAIGKLYAEHLCRQYTTASLSCLIARCFTFVGPGLPLDEHFAIGNFIGDALNGREIIIKGDGTPYRTYLYAGDLVVQLLAILTRGSACHPYNVGHSEPYSIAEVAQVVSDLSGVPYRVQGVPVPGVLPARYVPEIKRIRELGIPEPRNLREAVQLTFDWHRSKVEL